MRTYIGSTNDLRRRLRQHRREIVGGARATAGRNDWDYLWYLGCSAWTHSNALSAEWHLKHPRSKTRSRILALREWLEQSPPFAADFVLWLHPTLEASWAPHPRTHLLPTALHIAQRAIVPLEGVIADGPAQLVAGAEEAEPNAVGGVGVVDVGRTEGLAPIEP